MQIVFCEHITTETKDYYKLQSCGVDLRLCQSCFRDLMSSVTRVQLHEVDKNPYWAALNVRVK